MSIGDMWFHSDYIELLLFLTLEWWCHLVIFGFTIPILQTLGTYCLWPFVDLKATFFLHLNSTWEDSEDSSFPLAPTITLSPTPELLSVLIVVAGRFPHLVTLSESSQPKQSIGSASALLTGIFRVDSIAASLFENNCLSWQVVPDDKIWITLLILWWGALSNFGLWWWSWSTLCPLLWFVLGGSLSVADGPTENHSSHPPW